MSKTVREVEFKFFATYLDAVMDENYFLHSIDVEDNVIPEYISLECKELFGVFRLKSMLRNATFVEKIFLKQF